ncbi:hypothetical protein ACOQFO_09435 [Ureibacillus sp. MALMAid1270]|uniref:hypothetical protein n=1 Tax=Ureibacillus sp. MALMAid1270 TaxID=3411629 RepID=UPI003BA4F0CC
MSLHDEAKKNYEEVEQRFLVNSAIFTTTAAATAIPEVEGAILTNHTVVDSYEYDESISDDVEEYSYESTVVDVDVEEYEEEIFYANGTNDINDFMTNPYNDFIDEDPYESPISNFDSEEGFTSYPSFEEDYDYDRNPYDYPGESVEIDENYHHLI